MNLLKDLSIDNISGWAWHVKQNANLPAEILAPSPERKRLVKKNALREVFVAEDNDGARYYLKFFKPLSFFDKIKAQAFPKAGIEYKSALALENKSVPCVEYLAWASKGACSVLLSREMTSSENALHFWFKTSSVDADMRKRFLKGLSGFLKCFFASGFFHPDFHLGNLLVNIESCEFAIVDPYGIREVDKLSASGRFEMQRIIGALRGELEQEEALEFILDSGMSANHDDAENLWRRITQAEAAEMRKLWEKRKTQILSGKSKYCKEKKINEAKWMIRNDIGGEPMTGEDDIADKSGLESKFELKNFSDDDAEKIWLSSFKLQFHRLPHLRPVLWKSGKDEMSALYFEKPESDPENSGDYSYYEKRAEEEGLDIGKDNQFVLFKGKPRLKNICALSGRILVWTFLFFAFIFAPQASAGVASKTVVSEKGPYVVVEGAVIFPQKLGGFEKLRAVEYESEKLGVSVRYMKGSTKADIYIYNMGRKSVPPGSRSEVMMKCFTQAVNDIFLAEKRGFYSGVEVLFRKEVLIKTANGPLNFLCAGLDYKEKDIPRISYLLMSGYENNFIKIRFTFHEKEKKTGKGEKSLKKFLGAFGELLRGYLSKKTVLDAVSIFEKDPLGAEGKKALAIIIIYAEKSPDALIVISPEVTPWINGKGNDEYNPVLIGSFIAGDLKSQLESGKKEDDAYSGLLQTFKVYKLIKEKDKDFNLPELDKLIKLKAEGKLKNFLLEKKTKKKQNPE